MVTINSLEPAEANATDGAQAGTNLKDSGGTVLGDGDVITKDGIVVGKGDPGVIFWNTDPDGNAPSGDPTEDLTAKFLDIDGTEVASRTVRAQLDSSAGTITITNDNVSVVGRDHERHEGRRRNGERPRRGSGHARER